MHRFSRFLILFIVVLIVNVFNAQGAPPNALTSGNANTIKPDSVVALKKAGWKLPTPPYPKQAANNYYRGMIYVQMTTDSNRRVVNATIVRVDKSANLASLRTAVIEWALYSCSGPSYSTATVGINFNLH